MTDKPKNYSALLGMNGFSDALLTNHFTLYEGYVKNVNALADLAKTFKPGTPEFAEVRRRFGWEWNGMRLHELYFENLKSGGAKCNPKSALAKYPEKEFGKGEKAWEADFRALATMRGIGWVVLYKDVATGRLFNTWINEHDAGHLAGATPICVLDVFEHAYMLDYGLKKPAYIDAFFANLNWPVLEQRFKG